MIRRDFPPGSIGLPKLRPVLKEMSLVLLVVRVEGHEQSPQKDIAVNEVAREDGQKRGHEILLQEDLFEPLDDLEVIFDDLAQEVIGGLEG
jgi:hypothetical protein